MGVSRLALFRQLPLSSAFRLAISAAARKLFDPCCKASYAQFGEDRRLLFYLLKSPSKYYVDIGCHYPARFSNTFFLYQTGWRGLCVDANESLIREFRRARPKDTIECVCVGAESGAAGFIISGEPALSHIRWRKCRPSRNRRRGSPRQGAGQEPSATIRRARSTQPNRLSFNGCGRGGFCGPEIIRHP